MAMSTPEAPLNLKLLLIGNSSVGKSSLLTRFTDATFTPEDESSATIGVDFRVCKMQDAKGRKVKLSIWDTAGQERFRTITSSYYRGAQGIILVYDVSNRETFDALPRWFNELETYVSPNVVKILVGNKLDKEFSRAISYTEGEKFAKTMNSLFVEASAKTNIGVQEAFHDLVGRILDTPALWAPVAPVVGTGTRSTNANTGNRTMPGTIDISSQSEEDQGTCNC